MPHRTSMPLRRRTVVVAMALLLSAVGGGLWASAASAATTLTVSRGGTALVENSQVKVGDSLRVSVSGSTPSSTVLLQLGPNELATAIATDAAGAGSVTITVPALPSDVYLITAISQSGNATFAVYVKNPAATVTNAEESEAAAAAANGTSSSTSSGSASKPTSTGSLAKSGPTAVPVVIAGVLFLALGSALVRVGAIPMIAGRHERRAGAHLAV